MAPKASIALCVTSVFLILTIIVNGSTTVLEARITGKQNVSLIDVELTSVLKVYINLINLSVTQT